MSTAGTPSLWEIRKAVKPWIADSSQTILFGCSGGADSMALALALFLEANQTKVIPVVVDHGYRMGRRKLLHKLFLSLKRLVIPKLKQRLHK
jgi:tRNA(Ile)-lysidine synthase